MVFFFTVLCMRYVPGGRAGAGAMLGILVGLVYAGPHLISFAVQPLTLKILFGWIGGAVIHFAIASVVVGAIYKTRDRPHRCKRTVALTGLGKLPLLLPLR